MRNPKRWNLCLLNAYIRIFGKHNYQGLAIGSRHTVTEKRKKMLEIFVLKIKRE